MSRVANNPILVPSNVDIKLTDREIKIEGKNGFLSLSIHELVNVVYKEEALYCSPKRSEKYSESLSGTLRALISNMVYGVDQGFVVGLQLVGVGYRAQLQGRNLALNLGYSHPIEFISPEGITIEVPNSTEILIKGADKRKVGQVAADIRNFRLPEPYKGKGIRYTTEIIVRKEAKKK
ncbi:50S ribosomal protein L6 [Candidatus Nitrosacidococcus tergens]|uniref:Large ribosomal subunit protein uL6 n=1 Tax=Candidatus Nitrosacidococcus tergens TaxID=553981 RepID=A0A7G1Q7Y1_9GAMM|nr:50S ribosomal protein L6 [Candidatus Nitrosacidococcus tergens]CAB1274837.1 50S ribosomal subunit protein L6 [Candidatus Nitrosacidococcus tergens]